jgi:hypothetical protein
MNELLQSVYGNILYIDKWNKPDWIMPLFSSIISFSLLIYSLIGFCQENHSIDSAKIIRPEEVWGYWQNPMYQYNSMPRKSLKSLGPLADDKIPIPVETNSGPDHIEIDRTGKFIDPRYPNARWKLEDNYIYVKPEFGPVFRIFIYRNNSTHEYSFLHRGERFVSIMHRGEKNAH